MLTYVKCPECSACIGEVAHLIYLVRIGMNLELEKKYEEYDITKLSFNDSNISIGFALDLAGAKLECCRQHLLGMEPNKVKLH